MILPRHSTVCRSVTSYTDHQPRPQPSTRALVKDYQRMCAWKDTSKVVESLYKNVVYHEPESDRTGLVVINKPYGLALHKADDSAYCLYDCLGDLARKLEVEKLEVMKCAERFSSGITLLSTSKDTVTAYKKSVSRLQTHRILSTSYLAMVKGQPDIENIETVDRIMTDCPDVNKPLFGSMHKEPVLSRNLVKFYGGKNKNKVKRVHVSISSLARSAQGCGVVEISPSSSGNHFIPVYLADVGYPLLGDQMYDYRAKSMMGQRVKLSTAHTNAKRMQVLPTHLLDLLGMAKGEEWMMPKMLHLHRIFLPGWLGRDKDLTVFAPPPPHWVDTCKVLGLHFDHKVVAKEDKVKHWDPRVRSKKESLQTNLIEKAPNTDLAQHVSELT